MHSKHTSMKYLRACYIVHSSVNVVRFVRRYGSTSLSTNLTRRCVWRLGDVLRAEPRGRVLFDLWIDVPSGIFHQTLSHLRREPNISTVFPSTAGCKNTKCFSFLFMKKPQDVLIRTSSWTRSTISSQCAKINLALGLSCRYSLMKSRQSKQAASPPLMLCFAMRSTTNLVALRIFFSWWYLCSPCNERTRTKK